MISFQTFKSFESLEGFVHGFTYRSGNGAHELPFGNQHMGLLSFHYQDEAWDNIKDLVYTIEQKQKIKAVVATEQIHEDHLEVFSLSESSLVTRDGIPLQILNATDGVFTQEKDVLLMTFYADCTPVYFIDTVTHAIGMVHSGWKGTSQKIAAKGLGFMRDHLGSGLADMRVVIGPSASVCCYEVDQTVYAHFPEQHHCFEPTRAGHYKMDMKQIITEDLLAAGLSLEQIEVSTNCTLCQQELYYSHRGEGGNTGRMAAFMMVTG